jgi:4-amino-4-deoxy-L-arabinose transferase-like glycosyltransferase
MRSFFAALTARLHDAASPRLFLALCALWLCFSAGLRPLTLPDEGRYIGVAWEMLNSGNWLVPTLDGMPFFHKPPLFYWIAASGLSLFGAVEWAGRLPSLVAALVMVISLHAFVRRHVDLRRANLAVGILATLPFFFVGAQFANLDMLVAGMISATVLCGANAILALEQGQPHRGALAAAYVFTALGILAKGLIGIVLPGAILFAWLLLGKRFRLIPRLFPLSLILLFIALVAPWFILMEKTHPGFLHYFFVYHHFQRFAETGFNNQRPLWFYLPVLLALALPWSIGVWHAGKSHFLFERERFAIRSLMLLWLLGILVFFSLPSSKLVGYILPSLPPFAYLIADALLTWQARAGARQAATWIGASLLIAVLGCSAVIPVATHLDAVTAKKILAADVPQFAADDQIAMIEEYQYDMPFYLRARTLAWVVSDWTDPQIPKKDNWRKELFDAGQFDPAAMQKVLIQPDDFAPRLCRLEKGALWVWGRADQVARYPFLEKSAMAFSNGKKNLWRLDTPARQALTICRGMPSNG